MSYTTFRYAPLVVSRSNRSHGVIVRTSVPNAGSADGDEVTQLYLKFPDVPGVPNIALRGFHRVHLARGETKPIEFKLGPQELSSVSSTGERRVVAGRYRVSVGGGQPGTNVPGSSANLEIERESKVTQ